MIRHIQLWALVLGLALGGFGLPHAHAMETMALDSDKLNLIENRYFLATAAVDDIEQAISLLENKALWSQTAPEDSDDLLNPMRYYQAVNIVNPSLTRMDLYIVGAEPAMRYGHYAIVANGHIKQLWSVGSSKPFHQRPVDHRFYLLPFSLEPGELVSLVWNDSNSKASLPSWIEQRSSFLKTDGQLLLSDGFYFGCVAVMSLLILLHFFSSRETTYLYLWFILVGNGLYHLCRNGYGYQYIWPNAAGITETVLLVLVNCSSIGSILFSDRYLKLADDKLWLHRISMLYLAYNLFVVALVIFTSTPTALPAVIANALAASIYFIILWAYAGQRSFQGDMDASFYFFGWSIFLTPTFLATINMLSPGLIEIPAWVTPRNGEILLAASLYAGLLFHFRQALLEKQAAVLEAKSKTQFVATMSHELRTPLNGVIGMAELLQKTEQSATQRQYSNIIINSGKALLALINDVLDLTKITEGKLILEQKLFDFDALLSNCSTTFLPNIVEKKLPMVTSLSPDMPLKLIGDEYRIRQIMLNLLSNAVKFTDRGSITVTAFSEPMNIDSHQLITISVTDTGVGIEEHKLRKIFNEFSQADASTTRRFGGTGLGLTISKAIIEKMGGSISVESELGQGSTFVIKFPIEVDNEAEADRVRKLMPLKGKRILGITNTAELFANIMPHMEKWGVVFDLAGDESEARKLLEKNSYDALITYNTGAPIANLKGLESFALPLLVIHHIDFDLTTLDWHAKLLSLPVPAPIQKISETINELFADVPEQESIDSLPTKKLLSGDQKILVVEDNKVNQAVAIGMLKSLGIQADVANNGLEAVELMRSYNYPVVFMDCEMPVMDGYQASEQILAMDHDPSPIIIALTAHAMGSTTERCSQAGMSQVLHKPVTLKDLKTCLEGLNTGKRLITNAQRGDSPKL